MIITLLCFLCLYIRTQAILNGLNGTSSGWQIYPGDTYHYGPSILIDENKDNLIHMWTCSQGTGSTQWDVIRYHNSSDSGKTWSLDEIALEPTSGSQDTYSACDPGVVKIKSYYYIGYTSTTNPNATQNQLFLARSLTPNGNYEKWNGTGWNSSNPQPIVAYHGPSSKYGIGEPSLVLVDNLIYVYYTNADDTGSYTDLAIVQLNATNEDTWPLYLQYKGHVIYRRVNLGEDSTDIKWCPQLQRFIGVTTVNRFSSQATVGVYQSTDRYGLQFQSTPYIGHRVQEGTHNIGISGSTTGWIQLENQYHFVSYAYQPQGSSWGKWPTYLTPVQIVQLPLGTVIDVAVSSNVNWSMSGPFVWDHNFTTYWSSQSANNEFLTINLGTVFSVKTLSLVSRSLGYGFPVDFAVRASNDSQNFVHIIDQHYTNTTTVVNCSFTTPVQARYLQVLPITYGTDEHGIKLFQLAEIYVQTD
ncbi:unnamed protein product [Adineta ricciae]|uniref:F5/8 type C domain-containing protein n=1 Tax=Adineta ricciae TaxID=249248 RepID=A0A815B9E5_ADIRI|nr:unnamed protein product [Adineta ricciae]